MQKHRFYLLNQRNVTVEADTMLEAVYELTGSGSYTELFYEKKDERTIKHYVKVVIDYHAELRTVVEYI